MNLTTSKRPSMMDHFLRGMPPFAPLRRAGTVVPSRLLQSPPLFLLLLPSAVKQQTPTAATAAAPPPPPSSSSSAPHTHHRGRRSVGAKEDAACCTRRYGGLLHASVAAIDGLGFAAAATAAGGTAFGCRIADDRV